MEIQSPSEFQKEEILTYVCMLFYTLGRTHVKFWKTKFNNFPSSYIIQLIGLSIYTYLKKTKVVNLFLKETIISSLSIMISPLLVLSYIHKYVHTWTMTIRLFYVLAMPHTAKCRLCVRVSLNNHDKMSFETFHLYLVEKRSLLHKNMFIASSSLYKKTKIFEQYTTKWNFPFGIYVF